MDTQSTTVTPDLAASVSRTSPINFYTIDYVVFGALLTVSMAIGIYFGYFSKSEQTTEEYLLGGRKMKTIPIAISLIASQLSAMAIVGVPAEAYGFGSTYMISIGPIIFLVTLFTNYAILPVFYNNNIDNCYTYLELRFSKSVKDMITVLFFITVLLTLPIHSYVPALTFAQVTGLNIHLVNVAVGMICVLYTMMGGIKAVVWTDVIQASVMVVSMCFVFVYAVVRVGGFETIFARAVDGGRLGDIGWTLDLTTRQTIWNMVLGTFSLWCTHIGLNQSCVQRLVALPSINHARRALVLVSVGIIAIITINSLIGVTMYAYYYDCDPFTAGAISRIDKLVPYFVNDLVGNVSGMPGLFISCVFSASLSTVSAYLNSVAGIIYKDYICKIRGFKHTESRANVIMKSIVVAVGVYSVLLGFVLEKSSSLFQAIYTVIGLTTGIVFGVFTLGLFYPKANSKATLTAACITILFMAWLIIGGQVYREMHSIGYHSLPASTAGCDDRNITVTPYLLTNNTTSPQNKADNTFYNISFSWYGGIGALIVWLLAIPLSHIIGPRKGDRVIERSLISPVAQFMLAPQVHRHIEMQVVENDANKQFAESAPNVETVYAVR